jgi:hypothetical protein
VRPSKKKSSISNKGGLNELPESETLLERRDIFVQKHSVKYPYAVEDRIE